MSEVFKGIPENGKPSGRDQARQSSQESHASSSTKTWQNIEWPKLTLTDVRRVNNERHGMSPAEFRQYVFERSEYWNNVIAQMAMPDRPAKEARGAEKLTVGQLCLVILASFLSLPVEAAAETFTQKQAEQAA
jgi:hypothetical protein